MLEVRDQHAFLDPSFAPLLSATTPPLHAEAAGGALASFKLVSERATGIDMEVGAWG